MFVRWIKSTIRDQADQEETSRTQMSSRRSQSEWRMNTARARQGGICDPHLTQASMSGER